jgi:ubiquinone/menaquinone biosynthesis C-methylase UbiE
MKRQTLEILLCPHCGAELSIRDERGDGTVDEGTLVCARCAASFPIRAGIPRFIDAQQLEGPNRRFAQSYDRLAPFYTLFSKVALLPFGGERRAREEILSRLELKGGRILEVSIGNGVNLPYLFATPTLGQVYGLDISTGQLARCRKLASRRGWPVDLFLAMAEQLPFRSGSFDTVFHIGGINFFTGKKQAIEEMIRVARLGSKIVIADEAERLARIAGDPAGSSPGLPGEVETTLPALVPEAVEDLRLDGIWKQHGKFHGYCLEFRKPA